MEQKERKVTCKVWWTEDRKRAESNPGRPELN
jgi:hypothetical protein